MDVLDGARHVSASLKRPRVGETALPVCDRRARSAWAGRCPSERWSWRGLAPLVAAARRAYGAHWAPLSALERALDKGNEVVVRHPA